MPDTGAPHFIPFLDGTELVRAYPDFSEDLAEQVADGLSDASKIKQVVAVSDNTPFTSTSTSYVAVPNLEVTITPEEESSSILILGSLGVGYGDSQTLRNVAVSVFRGGTNLGLTAGSRTPALSAVNLIMGRTVSNHGIVFLDEPNTTSPVTYSVRVNRMGAGGTVYVHAGDVNTNNADITRVTSSLVVVEVAP